MGFESLLGNQRLKDNLRAALSRDRASHFYLISGPAGSGKHTLSRLLAAGLLCDGQEKPCLKCPACRKVMNGTHPDFITVDDPEKKTVPVELIRRARDDIFIRPNEGKRKIYLFPRAQDMGIPGQNALLKVLEEPPSYGVFLLLTDHPQQLLPTVRSRCAELSLQALPEQLLKQTLAGEFPHAGEDAIAAAVIRSGGYLGQARALMEQGQSLPPQTEAFAQAYAARSSLALIQVLVPMEKWKRDQLIPMLSQWLELLQSALICRSGIAAPTPIAGKISARRSPADLMAAIGCLEHAVEYLSGNVSPAAICGYLEHALR